MSADSLILASKSEIRRRLLEAAGIRFTVQASRVDEEAFDAPSPRELALTLARAKAEDVSERRPGAVVCGSDQVFTFEGLFHPKPMTEAAVRKKLAMMNGASHEFHCGLALVRDGDILFECVDVARVTFHDLSDDEIEDYAATGEGIGCAGGYRLEEGGVRLIKRIEGSHFTILGLPMIPLVDAVRDLGWAETLYHGKRT